MAESTDPVRRPPETGGRLILVEDDDGVRETFARYLRREGFDVAATDRAEGAFGLIGEFAPDIVLTDIRLPGMDGLELLGRLREALPDLDVIVMTGHEDMQTAVGAMRLGAYDYLVKPLGPEELVLVLRRCMRDRAARKRMQQAKSEPPESSSQTRLVGRTQGMIEIYKMIGALAGTRAPVFIRGETGTGKEVIARAVHFNSPESDEPFVGINCTELPETLLESELFGHTRGAFTGAVQDRKGRFELAGSGTLFLDEIGNTSLQFQSKLLRVLQEKEFYPVGSERPKTTKARVIAATNQPVEKMVREGTFREDLYFRLKVMQIRVPPLRERREDIPLLAEHLLRKISRDLHKDVIAIPENVMAFMMAYDWPGNVRELENALTRAVVLARGPGIAREDMALLADEGVADTPAQPEDDTLAAAEAAQIRRVLAKHRGNKRRTARSLEISRPRLDRLLDKYDIDVENFSRQVAVGV